MSRVLVLEDESDVRDLLVLHLKREQYEVEAFEDAEEALKAFKQRSFDLLVLDWMLPKMSGLDFCKKIRTEERATLPIMILTARADTMDKVIGLEIGADDYLTKPFEIREFTARVRALLRRSQPHPIDECRHGSFNLNDASKRIYYCGTELNLTPNEFKILAIMIKKPGITFERDELIHLVQGPNVSVVDRTVDTTILGIRKKLGSGSEHIETVRGFGYRLKS